MIAVNHDRNDVTGSAVNAFHHPFQSPVISDEFTSDEEWLEVVRLCRDRGLEQCADELTASVVAVAAVRDALKRNTESQVTPYGDQDTGNDMVTTGDKMTTDQMTGDEQMEEHSCGQQPFDTN